MITLALILSTAMLFVGFTALLKCAAVGYALMTVAFALLTVMLGVVTDALLSKSAKFTFVTCLSLSRFFAGMYFLVYPEMICINPVWVLFFITDACDGILARRWGVISNIGGTLDQIADKFLCFCVLKAMVTSPAFNSLYILFVLIVARDLIITIARVHVALPVTGFSKAKTTLIVTSILMLYLSVTCNGSLACIIYALGVAMLCTAVALSYIDLARKLYYAHGKARPK